MGRSDRNYNNIEDPFDKMCALNKIEDVNLNVFNMIKGINESRTLAKHISCEFRCEFDVRKCNSIQKTMRKVCVNMKN